MNCMGCPMLRILVDESLKKVDKKTKIYWDIMDGNKQQLYMIGLY